MKKIFIILAASMFLLSTNSTELNNPVDAEYSIECKYRQCNATAKSTEKRCKRCVSNPDDYKCYQHKS